MTTRNRILVVTPTLGDSEYLDASVAAVAAQPLDILHVISTPASRVPALQARYPHTRVVADAGKAGGIYGAINTGIVAGNNDWEWFTYINDDDLLLPGFAEAVRRHIAKPAPEPVLYGDVEMIDGSARVLSRITVERDPSWIPALLQQGISPLMQQGMLFRRETVWLLCGFDTRYRLCADLDFWLRAYAAGEGFCYYPLRVAQFRIRPGQLSGSTTVTQGEQDEIVARHLARPISALRKKWARWRYRLWNLPRYIARARSRGFRTSYELLQGEGASR